MGKDTDGNLQKIDDAAQPSNISEIKAKMKRSTNIKQYRRSSGRS